ncbi:PEP-CTERM sorting domain-containing protein [Granulicella sp. dw_53]|uniref:PEP-CTERM sorting domain-containing protein n=1 Tax=Granulicella sp. dw_53 TaxID=2719792 RepID=UPI001BD445C1|nr:PEP-CTERM sorting domain-containing protein [Granulicella sp. dw_53]
MKKFKLSSAAVIFAVVATLFTFSGSAAADTYQIFDLSGPDNLFGSLLGITAAGDVVVYRSSFSDYLTFSNGALVSTTNTSPFDVFDNGTPCSVPAGFLIAGASVCNNGRTFFGSIGNPNGEPTGAYAGPPSGLTFITANFDIATPLLNSSGDIVWLDFQRERMYQAINVTSQVPEPASLLLVGTGCASFLYGIRSKFSQPA